MVLAFERTLTKIERLDDTVKDIVEEFKDVPTTVIVNALRKGSLGHYGQCYKLSTLQACIWIRQYLKEHKFGKGKHAHLNVGDLIMGKEIIGFTQTGSPLIQPTTDKPTSTGW